MTLENISGFAAHIHQAREKASTTILSINDYITKNYDSTNRIHVVGYHAMKCGSEMIGASFIFPISAAFRYIPLSYIADIVITKYLLPKIEFEGKKIKTPFPAKVNNWINSFAENLWQKSEEIKHSLRSACYGTESFFSKPAKEIISDLPMNLLKTVVYNTFNNTDVHDMNKISVSLIIKIVKVATIALALSCFSYIGLFTALGIFCTISAFYLGMYALARFVINKQIVKDTDSSQKESSTEETDKAQSTDENNFYPDSSTLYFIWRGLVTFAESYSQSFSSREGS